MKGDNPIRLPIFQQCKIIGVEAGHRFPGTISHEHIKLDQALFFIWRVSRECLGIRLYSSNWMTENIRRGLEKAGAMGA